MKKYLRPPAVPLVTTDPFFSIWSVNDKLYEGNTVHWTGKEHALTAMLMIDGRTYGFMGKGCEGIPHMQQTSLEISALNTVYTFEAAGVELKLEFTTPLLMDDLEVMARPISYMTFRIRAIDGKAHAVKVYLDASAQLCVNTPDQEVVWGEKLLEDGSKKLYIGTKEQPVLATNGDDHRIDWGYACMVIPSGLAAGTFIGNEKIRNDFILGASLGGTPEGEMPRKVGEHKPVMAACTDFGTVTAEEISAFIVLAYDDIYAMDYFGNKLKGYWAKTGKSFDAMLVESVKEYGGLMKKCASFDAELKREAVKSGGEYYADILSLAYRQSISAHKLVADMEGEVVFLSKECFSNGCVGTVDVSYPSAPLFLLYNTELVKGMLRPIFTFARMPVWDFDFAPHDVGCYPHANGQVYGLISHDLGKQIGTVFQPPIHTYPSGTDVFKPERQMPVEECGNMLILTAAVCLAEKNADFAEKNWDLLEKWMTYLKEYGIDPGDQLCTDDFAGHLAHNANLSIKAIMGIAGYGLMCGLLGKTTEAKESLKLAKEMAVSWEEKAWDDGHYRLAFDAAGSWSQKYNLIWDELFKTKLFQPEVVEKEIRHYLKMSNRYGTPLDSRKEYCKTDWLIWCAAMASKQEDFEALIRPMWDFLNETPCRVPFTDWYETVSGMQTNCMCHNNKRGFRARSVQGGLFMKLLKDKNMLEVHEQLR